MTHRIRDLLQKRLQIRLCTVQKRHSLRLLRHRRQRHQLNGQQHAQLPRGHKDNDRLRRTMPHDRVEDRLIHGGQARRIMIDIHALDVELQRDRPSLRMEIERVGRRRAQPRRGVLGVGQGMRQRHDPDGGFFLLGKLVGEVAHTGTDHLHGRALVAADELELVDDEEVDGAHVLTVLPTS